MDPCDWAESEFGDDSPKRLHGREAYCMNIAQPKTILQETLRAKPSVLLGSKTVFGYLPFSITTNTIIKYNLIVRKVLTELVLVLMNCH